MKKLFYEEIFDRERKPVIGIDNTGSIVYMNLPAKKNYLCTQKEGENLKAENIFENFNPDKLFHSLSPKNHTVHLLLKNNGKKRTFGLFNIPQSNNKNLVFLISTDSRFCSDLDALTNSLPFNVFFENPLYGVIIFFPLTFEIIKYNTAAGRIFQVNSKKKGSITALFEGNKQSDNAFSVLLEDVVSGRMSIPQPYCIELERKKNHALRILVNLDIIELDAKLIAVLTFSDITFQKIEELRISQAEDRYRSLVELSPEGMMVLIHNQIVYYYLSNTTCVSLWMEISAVF